MLRTYKGEQQKPTKTAMTAVRMLSSRKRDNYVRRCGHHCKRKREGESFRSERDP